MNKSSSVATQKPSSSPSAWANGPPPLQQPSTASPSRSPSSTTPAPSTPTHSRKSSILSQAVSVKDGVSVPRGIAPSSSHRNSGLNFGTIEANGSSGPSAAASNAGAAPPLVNGSAGTPPPTKDASAAHPQPKAFGTLPAQASSTTASSTAASSTAAPSPTPSNASTAATSSAAPPKRKLDANSFFRAAPPAQPAATSAAPPPNASAAPPAPSAVPPSFHPNPPNSSVMAANVAANSPSQRFQTLPPPVNHGVPYYQHSPQMANQQPVGVGGPQTHLRPVQPATGGPRSPSFSSRPPINGAGVPPPNVNVNGASQGRGPQPAAGQPTGAPTGTVPQVGSPRLGHQPPVMQHQQQQPPGGPVPAPGQMPGQAPYPPSQMPMGWQQPPYGGWQPQYPQYPYMNTEWYPHMQHPHMHQHPHQPPYMQPPGTPHQPFASALPPTQQPPTPANTMSPRTGPMPALPPQASSPAVPHPGAPQINTNLPPSVPSTPAPVRPSLTTPLTAGAREFVPSNLGGSSPMIPSPGFPLPKKSNAIKISNPNTGEAVVLRPPDGGHSRTLSRDTAVVHESSPLRKNAIRMETQEEKRIREEKEKKQKEELEAKKKKEAEDKLKKEEEEREAKRKAEEAERLKKEEEERLKKEAEEKKRQEEEAEKKRLEDEKRRQEEEEARKKKEEEERIQREAEEKARKEKEEQERKEREERERKEREEAEAAAAAKAAEDERLRKEAEEAARLAAEAKAKEEAEAKEREEREKPQAPSLSRTASASSVATPLTASPKPGPGSLPAKPSLPPISTGSDRPRPARPVPGPLDLSHTQRPPLTPGLPSALASARKIDDLDSVSYPEGIKTPVEMNQGQTKGGKYKYDRDFLLQFMQICKDKPDNLSSLDSLGIERGAGDDSGPSFGSVGRNQRSRMGSMGPPPGNRSASGSIGLGLTGFPGGKGSAPFVMGNFSSTPSRMTSEERFAQSNRDRTVSGSGFMRGAVPMGRSSSQGGVGGMGGPNAVPPSPREQGSRTRSQRGRTRNDSLKPNAPQPSHQQQQQQQAALSGLEPVVPLQATENRWTPAARSRLAVDENSPEFVEKKVKGLLNKLTLENFDSVSTQIISWANKSENEKNGATLILVIKLVFEKATDEAHWSEMYARLCRKMMEQISQNVQDDNIRNSAGEPIVGGNLFRKYLLNRCQEDFERGWSQKESAQAAAALKAADDKAAEDASKANGENGEPVLYSDEYYALLKAKRQGLGLVRFIGELFKLQMLTERIMHECIKKLLSKIENPEEEEIESLCKLLTTVGQALDTQKAKGHMDIYFGRMQMLADNPNVASRIRYMLLDVIELRLRNWRPRNATAGPSTIAQVREQDAKEKAAAAQQASKIVPMARGGSQRGGRGQPEQGPDGWNVAGPTPVRAPAKAGDLSNFGKFTASTGPLKTMGPSSAFKKADRGRDTPPPGSGSSLSRAASGGNMYSLLGGGGADPDTMPKRTPSGRGTTRKASVDQAPQQAPDTPLRKKLALLPRTVSSTNTNEDSAGDEDKPESDEEQAGAATKSYTDKEATAKVEEDVKEFFNIRDVSEGEKSFAELPDEHKSKLVDKLASKALELKESDVKLVADLFERVASKGCPTSAFEDGLSGIIEFLDDMVIDVPQAYAFMARLLRGARLPQETVESLGDKIFVDGDPLVKPKDKLLKAYNALA